MKTAIWKFDEDLDEEISISELIKFLDSNMPEGKLFDRTLADKIFSVFDVNKDGKISVDEFIKTFIHIEEELKAHRAQVNAKYQAEKDKMNDLLKKANVYKGEKLNQDGIAPNAKLTADINTVEFLADITEFNNIKIRITYGNDTYSTKSIAVKGKSLNLNEKFEL
jgi:hypothetical protein